MEKKIKFFGVLRKFGDDRGYYITTLLPGMTAEKLKTQLKSELTQKFPNFDGALIDESALASESEVLSKFSVISNDSDIALLPPVCGG